MPNFQVQRALLSAKWEIEAGYGLRHLSRFLMESETGRHGRTVSTIVEAVETVLQRVGLGGKPQSGLTLISAAGGDSIATGGSRQEQSIAHITMSGPMMLDGGLCARSVRATIQDLRKAEADPKVGAILFEVDSGGGESDSGTELHNQLRDMTKPVVVYTQMLASAALRGTLAADAVYAAHSGTDIGSIGSYIAIDREQLAEIQENILYIYAEQSTEKNKDFNALLEGDEAPLRQYVTTGAQAFIDEVEQWRPQMLRTAEERARMQAGALFTAADAARMGLISGVATFGQVVQLLAGIIAHEAETGPQSQNQRPSTISSVAASIGIPGRALSATHNPIPTEVKEPIKNTDDVNDTDTQAGDQQETKQDATVRGVSQEQYDSLAGRVDELVKTVEAQATTIAQQDEKLTAAETERKKLNETIAKLKVGDSADVSNGKQADRAQFETAQRVDKATSKY